MGYTSVAGVYLIGVYLRAFQLGGFGLYSRLPNTKQANLSVARIPCRVYLPRVIPLKYLQINILQIMNEGLAFGRGTVDFKQ